MVTLHQRRLLVGNSTISAVVSFSVENAWSMEKVADSWSPDRVDLESGVLTPARLLLELAVYDSNFDIGGVRKALAKAEEVYSLFERATAKPPVARLKLATPDAPHDFPEPERQAAYEWLDGLLK